MSKEERPKKVKYDKFYTRAKSERLLTAGMDPKSTFVDDKGNTRGRFMEHPNYHVRQRAWHLMGRPLPEGDDELNKFLITLQGKSLPKDDEEKKSFLATLRGRFASRPKTQEVSGD